MHVEPAQHTSIDIKQVFLLLRSMTFARIDDELALDTHVLEPAMKLLHWPMGSIRSFSGCRINVGVFAFLRWVIGELLMNPSGFS